MRLLVCVDLMGGRTMRATRPRARRRTGRAWAGSFGARKSPVIPPANRVFVRSNKPVYIDQFNRRMSEKAARRRLF
jgi:hypothetical protein